MQFKKLDMNDSVIFRQYNQGYNFRTYEYSFLTLYLWREMLNVEYALYNGSIIVKKKEKDKGTCFMQPIGLNDDNIADLVEYLNEYSLKDESFKYLFQDVEFSFLNKLIDIYGDGICFCEDIDNFDYIYSTKELINLSGSRFHKKRNQYNQFIGSYEFTIKDLKEEDVVNDCISFSEDWYGARNVEDEQLEYELASIKEILPSADLFNIKGMAVYSGNKIVGYSVGEIVDDMAIVHIEKGDFNYKGVYAFINKTFAENYLAGTKYINRQEDLGIKGLRRAKKSYNPIRLEKKFVLDLAKNKRSENKHLLR